MPATIDALNTRALDFRPSSIDDEARTVELIASTGEGVRREDFEGPFVERLALTSQAVDLSRVDGMPLLDNHRRQGLGDVLGVVRSARIESGRLIITVQVSERAEPVWRDIKAGIIRNVSIGYGVDRFEDRVDRDSGQRERTVTRWTLVEVSLVPVGADGGAKVRSLETMPQGTPAPATPAQTTSPVAVVNRTEINTEIRALGETFDLPAATVNDLIDRGATVDEARAAAVEHVRSASPQTPRPYARTSVGFDNSDPAHFVTRAGEALFARSNPTHELSEAARQYAYMDTLDIARHCLQLRGIQTTGLSRADVITRALHTTSDFPQIFADTANRELRQAYEAAPATLKAVARQTSARDFRARSRLQLSAAPTLEKVNEAGEFKYGSMSEAGESYRIDTFGRIVGISRQAIVNDDVGAFTDLAGKFGQAAAEFEAQFLVDLLESNSGAGPTMSDDKALFHADHGNLADTGAVIGETALSDGRTAMRKQKGLDGRPINAAPRYMLVPPELETDAEKLLAAIQPTKASDVNPFGGKLELLVEARLSSAIRYYLVADPARLEGLEYAYLQGAEGPQTETRAGFEVDGVEVKVRLDFGAGFNDHRGWYQQPGSAGE
ncbi:MAG: Mu-like prophage major head subunit gpT family protein [Oceanicaulis sp.]|jgi:phage head maturation protease|nr:Mu-like prophage major head subunit gpT family protein [Oceanicaulis sp.]